jgi:CheY-like chemotaxis protein
MSAHIYYNRLFIIDDDTEDQEIFIEALKEVSPEIECHTATSWEEAVPQLISNQAALPELIFLDLNMPKLNGKQVLKELKANSVISSIPVIMYSTSFAPRDIQEIRTLGAVHHLIKPSRYDQLCEALKQILSTKWDEKV